MRQGPTWDRHSSHIVYTFIITLGGVDGFCFKTKPRIFVFINTPPAAKLLSLSLRVSFCFFRDAHLWCHVSRRHHWSHLHNRKMSLSLKRKKIFQKEKRHSSVLWKAFQISTTYFSFHRHFKSAYKPSGLPGPSGQHLFPVSMAWSDREYFYSPLDVMLSMTGLPPALDSQYVSIFIKNWVIV